MHIAYDYGPLSVHSVFIFVSIKLRDWPSAWHLHMLECGWIKKRLGPALSAPTPIVFTNKHLISLNEKTSVRLASSPNQTPPFHSHR